MHTHQTDFSKGSVYKNILEVAVPMTVAQFLNLLYNIVDRMYIGRIEGIGSIALTGVGLCFPIITLITAFTYLFGNGGGPSMRDGTRKREYKRSGIYYGEYLCHAGWHRDCPDDHRTAIL